MNFWEEADRLRLPGVGFSNDISPASGPVFMVENDDALAALKQAYEERYRIVFRNDGYDYVIENSREAIEFIERMRE
jgi:hypothetical protein